jgi:hypothetical protein
LKDNEILVRKLCDLTRVEEAPIFKNTGSGIVEERGVQTRDVAIGDRVVWIGVPANDRVTVPEYLFEGIPDGLGDNTAVFAGIGAFVIQAVRESGLTFGERVVVLGHGVLKKLASQIITLFGIHSLELDSACRGNVEIDGVFVCLGGEKDINLIANWLRNKATVTVLAEGQAGLPPELLQKRSVKLVFPALPQLGETDVHHPGAYVRWTIKKDMELFLKLSRERGIRPDHVQKYGR